MRLVVCFLAAVSCTAPCEAQSSGSPGGVPPPQRLTERDAVARLMASDPRIRAIAARAEEVRAAQTERTLWPNPSATYSRESVFSTHDTFLLARQELPISGRRGFLKTAGRIAADAAEAQGRFDTIQLQADVRAAYARLLLAQEREAALEGATASLQKLIALLRTREEGGEGSSYDRMRGERALLDLDAELGLAASERAHAQGQLAGYFGANTTPASLVAADTLTPAPLRASVTSLVEQALASRGDYRSTQLSVARFDAERVAAARLQVPTPTLSGGLKRTEVGDARHDGYQFSLDVSVPLFRRGQAAVALADAQKTRAAAEAESWRLRITAEVDAAYRVAKIQQDRALRYQASAAAISEPLAKIGRVGYQEGELSILELLDAERQALDARLRALDLLAAARRAAIDLDRTVGLEFRP